jgi:ribosome maturation factor RimP
MSTSKIFDHIESKLLSGPYELIEAVWDRKAKILRLFIDSPQGINLNDCATVSRLFDEDAQLDSFFPETYQLEVSSPGIDRPLTKLEHFSKVVGETIRVQVKEPETKAARTVVGTLRELREKDELLLSTDQGDLLVPYSVVKKANVVGRWN